MSEDRPRDETGKRGDPKIGAAEWLFREDPADKPAEPAGSAAPAAAPGETFELAGADTDEPETAAVVPPIPILAPGEHRPSRPRDTTRPKTAPAGESSPFDEDAVDVVWTRAAEWGPNLVAVGAWVFAVVMIVYVLMGGGAYGFAFVILLVGGAGAVVLSYPMLITMERPVRMTPEQAVRDFYGALSHHLPHYRRMWLLLARAGRTTSSYGSFEGFKAYWNDKLRTIKGSQAGTLTPLVFEIENYRGEKSAGKSPRRCQIHPQDLRPRPQRRRPHRLDPGPDLARARARQDVVPRERHLAPSTRQGIPPGMNPPRCQ